MTAVHASFDRGADTVLPGGAPFAGLSHGLSEDLGRIVLDGMEASVELLCPSTDAERIAHTEAVAAIANQQDKSAME